MESGGAVDAAVVAPVTLLDDSALAKVNALWDMVQKSHVEHGPDSDVTRALEAKLEDARRDCIGGSGPREVAEAFDPDDERWVDGCVRVEPGWRVSVTDGGLDWCSVRVNGQTGRVPASILRRPQEQRFHTSVPPSTRGIRRSSIESLTNLVGTESLNAAAGAASKGVTGLFSSARRLKAQLATAADELSAAAAMAVGNIPPTAPQVVDIDGESSGRAENVPSFAPVLEPQPQATVGELHCGAGSSFPSPVSHYDDLEVRRVFSASLFLRELGDVHGQLVFTANQLLFVPLDPGESEVSATFREARSLLWTTISPRNEQSNSSSSAGDATRELHRLVFAHAHVVYFGMETPAEPAASPLTQLDSSIDARMIAQSGIKVGAVPVPLPASELALEPEPEVDTATPRMHQLHRDLEALGLTPRRDSSGDDILPPQTQHLFPQDCGRESDVSSRFILDTILQL